MVAVQAAVSEVNCIERMKIKKLEKNPVQFLKSEGWEWIPGEDTLPYVTQDLVVVSEKEAEAYFEAANTLYHMFQDAAQHIIDNNLFEAMGISANLIPLIKYSWENDENWHLYGRFDFAGGLDNKPIKLIEFNADTATCIPETALMQWASLKVNGLEESNQFNTVFEALTEAFIEIKNSNSQLAPAILFSTMEGYPEDKSNVDVLMEAARLAGFETEHEYIELVEFSETEGVYKQNVEIGTFTPYDFWFKLVPWEFIADKEPELLNILTKRVLEGKLVVLNPAYTMLFQTKGILKVLWDLYQYHPLLLETSFEPLKNKAQVQKVVLGREGANVKIIRASGTTENFSTGDYSRQKMVYQEYTEFVKDKQGAYYQAGVFVSGEACGLGFRKGGQIIDNKAQFCGHIIED